jgi:hypothetical protein
MRQEDNLSNLTPLRHDDFEAKVLNAFKPVERVTGCRSKQALENTFFTDVYENLRMIY